MPDFIFVCLLFMGMGLGFLIWALYMEGKFHKTKKKKKMILITGNRMGIKKENKKVKES